MVPRGPLLQSFYSHLLDRKVSVFATVSLWKIFPHQPAEGRLGAKLDLWESQACRELCLSTACRKVNSETLRDSNDSKHLEKLCSTVKKINRKPLLYHTKDKTLWTKQLVWSSGVDNTHVHVLSLEILTSRGSVTQNHLSNHHIFSIHVLELSDMLTA